MSCQIGQPRESLSYIIYLFLYFNGVYYKEIMYKKQSVLNLNV